ncbi:MAG: RnfABCDGE type electron transport complex subunit D [Candidatus Bathyarchaeota archaeon]|nr:RnfABCDGE type electron transport complex subunit D [Candidatus Bathyarchaeota archaeon]MDW8023550.1 RnfABCDGE type electron transport complex subunit D [Nitrososphaerota archaeon]MDW8040594.1 RnfABCDGE type electron transport complex subunit D [Nitrososphaerota archaeon]
MSKAKEYSWMTKDKMMTYTLVALAILAVITTALWWPITQQGWSLGLTVLVSCIISVIVAIALDYMVSLVMKEKGPVNTMSAAVFGLIVALSYSYGLPVMASVELLPLTAPQAFIYVAIISALGLVAFKKLQGLLGRKYVNPAAAAKLLVLLPFLHQILLPKDHTQYIPTLAAKLVYEGQNSFASALQFCFANPDLLSRGVVSIPPSPSELFWTLGVAKYHGWAGGASSIAVIIVGIGLFMVARKYIKWRITAAYFASTIIMSLIMTMVYGGDALLRLGFHIFVGSSIFLAFFMATDPATTPLTHRGQSIFGVGLGVLTVLIQTYMNFFGGSILALIIMNLTSPWLDKVGLPKPSEEKIEAKLPRAQPFEAVKATACMRCGVCLEVCCHKLSPILIKEAFDKGKTEILRALRADLCDGCGHCTFVCPARIDLRSFTLKAKASLRTEKSQ